MIGWGKTALHRRARARASARAAHGRDSERDRAAGDDAELERLEDVAWDRDRALGRIERGTGRMISGIIAAGLGPVAAVYMAPFSIVLALSWIPGAAWVMRGALDRARGKRDLRDAAQRLELPAARLLR